MVSVWCGHEERARSDCNDPAEAYAGVPFDAEALLIYRRDRSCAARGVGGHPDLRTPAYPSTIDYKPKYFLVNGVSETAPRQPPRWAPTNRLLPAVRQPGLKAARAAGAGLLRQAPWLRTANRTLCQAAHLAAAGSRQALDRSWSRLPRGRTRSSMEGSTGRTSLRARGFIRLRSACPDEEQFLSRASRPFPAECLAPLERLEVPVKTTTASPWPSHFSPC